MTVSWKSFIASIKVKKIIQKFTLESDMVLRCQYVSEVVPVKWDARFLKLIT